jgi:hypothetical protein
MINIKYTFTNIYHSTPILLHSYAKRVFRSRNIRNENFLASALYNEPIRGFFL